jgi:hypothetical protein
MLPAVRNLPSPADFAKALREWLESQIVAVRSERGDVTAAEDTYALVRSLQGAREAFADYSRAFAKVAGIAAQEIENELLEAVGDNDGIPMASLNVPDTDGTTIKLGRNMPNAHTIDVDPIFGALALYLLNTTEIQQDVLNAATSVLLSEDLIPTARADFGDVLSRMMIVAMEEILKVGSFSPQISKVKALATQLAGLGQDDLAATVSHAVRTKKEYKGVTITREQPKK